MSANGLIANEYSEIGFLGEETGAVGNPHTYWVLDPIGGTINHHHGSPLCAIALGLGLGLGLVHDHQPILGVTALPFLGHRYWAANGHGAYRDGEPITVSATEALNRALIGFSDYGSGPDTGLRDVLCAAVDREITARAQGLRRCGSSALDLVWVADGTLDACVLLGNRDLRHRRRRRHRLRGWCPRPGRRRHSSLHPFPLCDSHDTGTVRGVAAVAPSPAWRPLLARR